jgi:hypothetical protein
MLVRDNKRWSLQCEASNSFATYITDLYGDDNEYNYKDDWYHNKHQTKKTEETERIEEWVKE